ncbi:MAG: hypothetical protein KME04_16380 [Pleurocapsa minor GSE-CHR-MK-17-07R]|jgi:hypothetical protein|nr:hypothetical protein [Pleurocapsa minor GSE-CHR-MK 17-07R]
MRHMLLRLLIVVLCIGTGSASASAPVDQVVTWPEANLAFALSPDWDVQIAPFESGSALIARAENALFAALVLPNSAPYTQESHAVFEQFYTGFLADGLGAYRIEPASVFGDLGVRINAGGAYSGQSVTGVYGRLPDHRILYAIGTEREFTRVLSSIALSANDLPQFPALAVQSVFSTEALPPPVVESTDGSINPPVVHGVAFAGDMPVASITPWGLLRFADGLSAPQITTLPRVGMHDLVVLPDGNTAIGDTGCRCLFLIDPDGTAGASFGTFAANAPFSLTSRANGDIISADGSADGGFMAVEHALQDDGTYKPTTSTLNFNAANAPHLIPLGDDLYVLETLQSLLDGEVHTGLSQVLPGETPRFIGWLPFAVGEIADIAPADDTHFIAGLYDGRVYRVGLDLVTTEIAQVPGGLTSVAWNEETSQLLAGTAEGTLVLLGISPSLDRIGGADIAENEVVIGTLSELTPVQTWSMAGAAGDIITLSAVDLQRRDFLDPALTLIAPSGAVVAENDDQQGLDLWSALDAQLRTVVLPEDGLYSVQVSRIGGDGQFALGLTHERRFALEPQAAVTLTGTLSDAIPVQRWAFQGAADQVVTFTMTAQNGDLDPALELLLEDGRSLAYNDDGADPALGLNAQIFRVTLPRDGVYILEASRFDYLGAGDYQIIAFTG